MSFLLEQTKLSVIYGCPKSGVPLYSKRGCYHCPRMRTKGGINAHGCLLSVGTSRWRDKRKNNCGECYYKLGQFYRRRVACRCPNLRELFPKTVRCSSETMFLELEEYGLL